MKIEIKSRFTGAVILSGEYETVKDCLEKNRSADLRGADLRGADLRGAYLRGADLRGAYLRGAYLRDAYLRSADLRGADLRGAYLRGADLSGADLRGADLSGAYLRDAYLRDAYLNGAYLRDAYLRGADMRSADLRSAKGYVDSHAVFTEVVRKQEVKLFASAEWVAIAQISIYRLCWDEIKKRFPEVMPSIFKKLADVGFDEWLKHWEEIK